MCLPIAFLTSLPAEHSLVIVIEAKLQTGIKDNNMFLPE